MSEENPWLTHSSKEVYDNPWIRVTEFQVTTPGGRPGIYGRVHFKNIAVGVVPLADNGDTWLVGQYRYVSDVYSWEIPEGGCPQHESPLGAAQRELKEETGIMACRWTPLFAEPIYLSNSVSDEQAVAFCARDLELGISSPEDTEQLAIRRLPFEEAVEMALGGAITDALSVLALLQCKRLLKKI